MTRKSVKASHQFTIDPEADGWTIQCSCGWSEWASSETGALNLFGTHEKDTADKTAFYQGAAVIVAALIRDRDEPSMAVDICKCNGILFEHFEHARVDSFDLKPIRKAFKDERQLPATKRKRVKK